MPTAVHCAFDLDGYIGGVSPADSVCQYWKHRIQEAELRNLELGNLKNGGPPDLGQEVYRTTPAMLSCQMARRPSEMDRAMSRHRNPREEAPPGEVRHFKYQ